MIIMGTVIIIILLRASMSSIARHRTAFYSDNRHGTDHSRCVRTIVRHDARPRDVREGGRHTVTIHLQRHYARFGCLRRHGEVAYPASGRERGVACVCGECPPQYE